MDTMYKKVGIIIAVLSLLVTGQLGFSTQIARAANVNVSAFVGPATQAPVVMQINPTDSVILVAAGGTRNINVLYNSSASGNVIWTATASGGAIYPPSGTTVNGGRIYFVYYAPLVPGFYTVAMTADNGLALPNQGVAVSMVNIYVY